MSKKYVVMTIFTFIIGFMAAIQFQSVQEPIVRDTRDTWQLREALLKEKELQLKLLREIGSVEKTLENYEAEKNLSKEEVLNETLSELKKEAGLTEVIAPGITITIEPAYTELLLGKSTFYIAPDLMQRLVNELNQYGALHISIDGNRVINTTVIRDINGITKVDGQAIEHFPLNVNVAVNTMDDAEKLYNRMKASNAADDFFVDNLSLSVSEPVKEIVIPAYQDAIRIRYMEPLKNEEGAKS
jgi:uncharacterized protein YlxW (UPF0749 family)